MIFAKCFKDVLRDALGLGHNLQGKTLTLFNSSFQSSLTIFEFKRWFQDRRQCLDFLGHALGIDTQPIPYLFYRIDAHGEEDAVQVFRTCALLHLIEDEIDIFLYERSLEFLLYVLTADEIAEVLEVVVVGEDADELGSREVVFQMRAKA